MSTTRHSFTNAKPVSSQGRKTQTVHPGGYHKPGSRPETCSILLIGCTTTIFFTRRYPITTPALQFYVSPDGDDAWDGRAPEASGNKKGPFATVTRARDAIREHQSDGHQGPLVVWLRNGTWFLEEPFRLDPRNSGTENRPVVYAAYPGEQPLLSGGVRIRNWNRAKVNGVACWAAELPEVREDSLNFTQLFVNGRRRPRTRLPRHGYYRFRSTLGHTSKGYNFGRGPARAEYHAGDIDPSWKNIADVAIVPFQLWFEMHHHIARIEPDINAVHFRAPSVGSLVDEKNQCARYYVENVFEALTEPGRWYLDRTEGTLYYVPLPEEDMATTEVVASRLENVLVIAGEGTERVHHVRFENITFAHTDWHPPYHWNGSVQAAFDVPGAVLLRKAEACVLYGCSVMHTAQYGIEVGHGCHDNRIVGCELTDLGAGGVRVDHEWLRGRSETKREEIARDPSGKHSATVISDCHIHHCGRIYHSAIGIYVGNAGENRIVHNHIHSLHYTGISVGWSWGYREQATVDNRIEHNYIHHINMDHLFSDNAAIYTLGVQPGTVIRHNLIHDVGSYGYGGEGIYPDEGSSEMLIENNIAYCLRHSGYSCHYGRDLLVRNNIFALARLTPVTPAHRYEHHRTAVFERNIFYWNEGTLSAERYGARGFDMRNALFRDNLFWSCGTPIVLDDGHDIAWYQARGQFRGSVFADPLFVSPAGGDFTLREGSPARKIGFEPIDMSPVGPRFHLVRALHYADLDHERFDPKPIVRTLLELVKPDTVNITLRNVGTLPASGGMELTAGAETDRAPSLSTTRIEINDLKPGEERRFESRVEFGELKEGEVKEEGKGKEEEKGNMVEFTVETVPWGDVIVPGFLWVGG